MILNLYTLLSAIPADYQYFLVIDLHGSFFRIVVEKGSPYLYAFTWKDCQLTWTVMPQRYTESSTYFLQILKADLNDVGFSRDFTLIQYVDDLFLYSRTLLDSQNYTI